ncbi:MAG TPA: universal stress protein [Flavobacterium sp.]|jgi:nucleotide-binding universal stress UspA family protein|nr:universal stress protein [Flavobacterium sp.]
MKNILVSIDFKDSENILIDKAFELAEAFKSKIWLLHIAAPDPDFVGYDVGPQYIRDTRASEIKKEHKLLQKYSSNLIEKGVEAESLLIQGATSQMILEESKKLKVDLLIIGHHEHNLLYKTFIGSVSSNIIDKSIIPVMLIPI